MAKKKIYAVRKGHKTGLFETWAECQKQVTGFSGAEFKSFSTMEEAQAFAGVSSEALQTGKKLWHSCKYQLLQMYLRMKKKKQQELLKCRKIW